jgi:uncharacterized membrane protein
VAEKETARLEAFSDGVFAIALTLLVIELKVPDGPLLPGLLAEWPKFLSFALSFLTVLIMWTNHHGALRHVVRVDGRLLFSNGLLLLFVTFMPFPTAVLGESLRTNEGNLAATFYAGTFVAINVAWIGFWRSIVGNRAHLAPKLTDHEVRTGNKALFFGALVYVAATAVSWFSGMAGIAVCILLAFYWTYNAIRHHAEDHDHPEVRGPA